MRELALLERPVADARAERALGCLRSGAPFEQPDALQALIDELDDAAAAFQLALDEERESGVDADEALGQTYGWTFEQARACAALLAALAARDDDAVVGDALYEAAAAIDYRPDAIGALVDAVLAGDPDPIGRAVRTLGR